MTPRQQNRQLIEELSRRAAPYEEATPTFHGRFPLWVVSAERITRAIDESPEWESFQ